jgi:hypothetical protein
MWQCPYGRTYEPDPPPGVVEMKGQSDPARPLVICPDFPSPSVVEAGTTLGLSVTFIGRRAEACAGAFWEAAAEAGLDRDNGLGPDRVTFEVEDPGDGDAREIVDLPLRLDSLSGVVPRLRVELLTPLVLTATDGDRKRPITQPTFADLFRAGLRTLGQLTRLWGEPVAADFAGLKEASATIRTVSRGYEWFGKRRSSNRTGRAEFIDGVTGSVVFADVPLSHVRWMHWAGRVHVGGHRAQGAGGWDLSWASDDDGPWNAVL